MSFSDGLHHGAGMRLAPRPMAFLHYGLTAGVTARQPRDRLSGLSQGGTPDDLACLRALGRGETSLWHEGVSARLDATRPDALAQLLQGVAPPLLRGAGPQGRGFGPAA